MIKKFLQLLLGSPRSNVEPLARQIAEQCLAEVCPLVEGRMQGMTLAEARGYVRARSTQLVLRQTRIAVANSSNVQFSDMAGIARMATERLIPQVIRKMHPGARHTSRAAA